MMDFWALAIAVAGLVPLMVYVGLKDTKDLIIPNWTVLAVLGIFLATGSWGLPIETFLWRLLYGVLAFAAGLAIYNATQGGIGAGDLKLLAAFAPFLHRDILLAFLIVYLVVSVVGSIAFIVARRLLKGRAKGWKAFDNVLYYPAGVFIGLTITLVMVAELSARFA